MNERPTPETDSQIKTFTSVSKLKKSFENRTGTVSAGFARKLERERDEAREEWGKASMDAAKLLSEKTKAIAERDEARELALKFRDALVSIEEYWNRDQNEPAMADACWHAVNMAHDALAEMEAAK